MKSWDRPKRVSVTSVTITISHRGTVPLVRIHHPFAPKTLSLIHI